MAKRKFEIITYTVEGSGMFPLYMLRYDSCWPYSGEDAFSIGMGYDDPGISDKRRVRLSTYRHQERVNEITHGRWRAFNWVVVETTET